jgi:hypothetical protein
MHPAWVHNLSLVKQNKAILPINFHTEKWTQN